MDVGHNDVRPDSAYTEVIPPMSDKLTFFGPIQAQKFITKELCVAESPRRTTNFGWLSRNCIDSLLINIDTSEEKRDSIGKALHS